MKKIFMTGGTGFLGSFLAIAMLRMGYFIYFLARNFGSKLAEERIDEALRVVDNDYLSYKQSYLVLEGDVSDFNRCGLSEEYFAVLKNENIDEVWHLAGSISFLEERRKETFTANVLGTTNVLSLSALLNPKQFHFSSTAYVCGDAKGTFFEDQLACGQEFHNPYEETKYQAEGLVRMWADKLSHIKTLIFRPSIIVGDSKDGKVCGYSGYYTYMMVYYLLKKVLFRKRNLVQWDGESIILPIEVPGVYDCPLNIVSIDYAVELMLKLASKGKAGVYNITADKPAPYGFWLDEGTKYLGFKGIRVKNGNLSPKNEYLSSVESKIAKGIHDYVPFVSYQPQFDKVNAKAVLGAEYSAYPEVNSEFIRTLLGYAVKHDFME